jgi:glycine cleavage system regulatory protein
VTTELVLTIIGVDKPGLVEALSRTVTEHGGNWEASRMARMAGRFAGILRVTVAAERAGELAAALQALEQKGLRVVVEDRVEAPVTGAARTLELEMVGNDRAGVIRDLSTALAARGVNIEDLETEASSAPMAGGLLLRIDARLRVPDAVTSAELRAALESVASDYMIDLVETEG